MVFVDAFSWVSTLAKCPTYLYEKYQHRWKIVDSTGNFGICRRLDILCLCSCVWCVSPPQSTSKNCMLSYEKESSTKF
jgi:hypothetical protein